MKPNQRLFEVGKKTVALTKTRSQEKLCYLVEVIKGLNVIYTGHIAVSGKSWKSFDKHGNQRGLTRTWQESLLTLV